MIDFLIFSQSNPIRDRPEFHKNLDENNFYKIEEFKMHHFANPFIPQFCSEWGDALYMLKSRICDYESDAQNQCTLLKCHKVSLDPLPNAISDNKNLANINLHAYIPACLSLEDGYHLAESFLNPTGTILTFPKPDFCFVEKL